jgi:hypothetical protein
MKKTIFLLLILSHNFIFSQDYLEGKRLYCKSENPEAIRLFNIGIKTLHLNKLLDEKYLKRTSNVFLQAYEADSTFCDAMFFAGYSLRLMNDKKAVICYYMADSLSNNKSIEFKTNLAVESFRFGNETGIELARKKYTEIIEYFPESPEGYYGFAMTSTIYGDVEKGLKNINIAIQKYKAINSKINEDVLFLKGILLTLNKKYDVGKEFLEMSTSYSEKDSYKFHYSLCLLEVSKLNNDKGMKRKAKRIYNNIKFKEKIPKEIMDLLIF